MYISSMQVNSLLCNLILKNILDNMVEIKYMITI